MPGPVPTDRLLAIIELQNRIVAAAVDLDGAIAMVRERARELTGFEAVVVEAGLLSLWDEPPASLGAEDAATLELLSGVIGAHLRRAGRDRELAGEKGIDSLTGLRNRRLFDERLESELARARRHGGQFALCLLDVERLTADGCLEALRAVADHLSLVRGEDAAYRLGDDEFAVVLVEASSYGAEAAIERVNAAMTSDPACQAVRGSWGVATFQRGDDAASMLARADAALYRARGAIEAV